MVNRILDAITAAILAVTVVIAFVAVIFRYVIESSLTWSFEASLVLLTYLTFIAGYSALRHGSHLKVDVFVRLMPFPAQVAIFAMNQLAISGIGVVMVVWGGRQTWLYHAQTTMVMEIPLGFLYVIIPLCGLAMAVDSLWQLGVGLNRVRHGGPLHVTTDDFSVEDGDQ